MPDTQTLTGLFWTVYAPVLLAFLGGFIMFRYRNKLKLEREAITAAQNEGKTLASIVSISSCQEIHDKCKASHSKRLEGVIDLHAGLSKEIHGRISELSKEFYETKGELSEAVRAVREGVVASNSAASQAKDAASEARIVAAEARVLVDTVKKNGYGKKGPE